ncbi:DMSO/selenate family reductase complex B subunit [Shewanella halifaxensis]|uniref:DMSO/selenate family reductase complex B subunit n=1 Tax=Shewanella halifaxensis TaxID=271098 RepID=UPI000D59F7BA|nr:DMSO/selenate family reductase complex B subunit [Shewanella halifaxensis]
MTELTQYGFHIDTNKCSGCKTCHIACKDRSDVGKDVIWRRVYEYGGGNFTEVKPGVFTQSTFAYYVPISCNHCDHPVCVKACPTGAMHKRRSDGLVQVEQNLCIGCESCARACPYDAPQIDRERKVMTKCDGCSDRLQRNAEGELTTKPICVTSCPLRALDFDTMDNLIARYPNAVRGELPALPSAGITHPNLLITVSRHGQRSDGKIMNQREV